MRVFCREHKRGFFAPRKSPIKCENQGHLLGELDFYGNGETPIRIHWQYCCNCEHLCPIDFEREGLEACPVCNRRTSLMYLCDRCHTITFESNPPLSAKNFTLTPEGAPQPSCPGCLQKTSADLREHDCDELGARFITALNSCPICLERLDVAPSFPSSVAQYLKKTKASSKVNATFDYHSELFVPIDDGEFVVVTDSPRSMSFVLPRSARFSSDRDFFELYQDYYHCQEVRAGEVHVIEPAVVRRVDDGWKVQSKGILEIVGDPLKRRATASNILSEPSVPSCVNTKGESTESSCSQCGSLVQKGFAFCWNCGRPATTQDPSTQASEMILPQGISEADDESTLAHNSRQSQPSIFSWAMPKAPATVATTRVLSSLAVVVIFLLLLPLGRYLLTRSAARKDLNSGRSDISSSFSRNTVAPTVRVPANTTTEKKTEGQAKTPSGEDDLRKLRQERIGASDSNRSTILQLFVRTEKQYPNDYRFPYERAKLAIAGPATKGHADAFSALTTAAEKAIKGNKAQEMLVGLEADKTGDFHKLSHGHREWIQIIEALKRKDPTLLEMPIAVAANAEF